MIAIREWQTKSDAKSGDRYHIFNETLSRLVTELWKMCTSLSAVALAKVGPRFSLTGSHFSFAVQQDRISLGYYTLRIVDWSIGSGLAGIGFWISDSGFSSFIKKLVYCDRYGRTRPEIQNRKSIIGTGFPPSVWAIPLCRECCHRQYSAPAAFCHSRQREVDRSAACCVPE